MTFLKFVCYAEYMKLYKTLVNVGAFLIIPGILLGLTAIIADIMPVYVAAWSVLGLAGILMIAGAGSMTPKNYQQVS